MTNDGLHKRRNSLRYPGRDYAQPGGVFVTICTHHRQRLFGQVVDGEMVPSAEGRGMAEIWHDLPNRFPGIVLDTFVIMPDHLHAILVLGANPLIHPDRAPSLADVIRWYKVVSQAAYSDQVRKGCWPRYERHLWQRGYHDRIIRTDQELERIRAYIEGNPARWQERQDAMTRHVDP